MGKLQTIHFLDMPFNAVRICKIYLNFNLFLIPTLLPGKGGGPRVVVSTAAFHARVRGSVPGLGGLKETEMFLPHPRVKLSTPPPP